MSIEIPLSKISDEFSGKISVRGTESFYWWIVKSCSSFPFDPEQTIIKDILKDKNFPKKSYSRDEIGKHLINNDAGVDAFKAIDYMWKYYSGEVTLKIFDRLGT